jgi:hypothetical protein
VDAHQACLNATSTADSPWYVAPADDRNNTRLILSQIVLDTFESLNLQHPIAGRSVREGTEGDTSPAKFRFLTQLIWYANTRTKAREKRRVHKLPNRACPVAGKSASPSQDAP